MDNKLLDISPCERADRKRTPLRIAAIKSSCGFTFTLRFVGEDLDAENEDEFEFVVVKVVVVVVTVELEDCCLVERNLTPFLMAFINSSRGSTAI